jgi:2-pyrone-4,6-dicarboxylate lactonase
MEALHSIAWGERQRGNRHSEVAGPGRLRGIALIGKNVTDAELLYLAESGIRGFRVNRTAKTGLSIEIARRLAERVKDLGWHVQFLLDVEDYPDLDRVLGGFATEVVIDHMGRPDPRSGVGARRAGERSEQPARPLYGARA